MTPRHAQSPTRHTTASGGSPDLGAAESRLSRAVEVATQRVAASRQPSLASITIEVPARDPIALLHAAHAAKHIAAFWSRPDEGLSLVGVGEASSIVAGERSPVGEAGKTWAALVRDCGSDIPQQWGAGPVAIGGFAFDHRAPIGRSWSAFGHGSLMVPRVAMLTTPESAAATLSVLVRPGRAREAAEGMQDAVSTLASMLHGSTSPVPSHQDAPSAEPPLVEELRPSAEWRSLVAEAASAVRRGALRKVVVARGVRVRTRDVDPVRALARLRAEYPSCALFAILHQDRDGHPRWFIGATPERLVRVRDGAVTAMALAGSAPRSADQGEDRRLGETLLSSAKDRIEHALVVDVMREALAATCETVEIDEKPKLLRLSNVQHLHTPMSARMRRGTSVLDLVDRLHPTPAVGGVPREDAMAWLREHERLDRGWYAGPIGWIDRHGEGEFSVAIRCALVGRGESLLYTGCGIVADSVPTFEYAESRLKLRPMLTALGAGSAASVRDGAS
jgi:isochorismate synthase